MNVDAGSPTLGARSREHQSTHFFSLLSFFFLFFLFFSRLLANTRDFWLGAFHRWKFPRLHRALFPRRRRGKTKFREERGERYEIEQPSRVSGDLYNRRNAGNNSVFNCWIILIVVDIFQTIYWMKDDYENNIFIIQYIYYKYIINILYIII